MSFLSHFNTTQIISSVLCVIAILTYCHNFEFSINQRLLITPVINTQILPKETDQTFTTPDNFTILIYNRVPKCASTTIKTVLRSLQEKRDYKVVDVTFQHEKHYLRLNESQYLDRDDLKWNNDTKKFLQRTAKSNYDEKLLYIRHTFYIPDISLSFFGHENINVYKYINVVKNPVDQYISWYYYERFGWNDHGFKDGWEHEVESGTEHLSFDVCLSRGFKTCTQPSKHSEFMGYFCGHDWYCFGEASEMSLRKAKENIEKRFIMIGLTSELSNTMKLLERVMPKWFHGVNNEFEDTMVQNRSKMVTKHLRKPSDETFKYLQANMKYEIELFEWIDARFQLQKSLYGLR